MRKNIYVNIFEQKAINCGFENLREYLIRDRIISDNLREKLLEIKNLTQVIV